MEKVKKLFEILFSVQFLLKILIIVAIIVLINGELKVDVNVYHRGSIDVGSESGGFKIKKIEWFFDANKVFNGINIM